MYILTDNLPHLKMSKRAAGTQLTDRNWEDEEEPEDVGDFLTLVS